MRRLSTRLHALWTAFRADTRGVAAMELALATPLLCTIAIGTVEIGRSFAQASAVEKGLRAGALYAARQTFPLGATARTAIENVIKTGAPGGTGPVLVSGWAKPGASVVIDDTLTYVVDGETYPKVRITATVPFDTMVGDFVPVSGFTIRLSHEQTYLGN